MPRALLPPLSLVHSCFGVSFLLLLFVSVPINQTSFACGKPVRRRCGSNKGLAVAVVDTTTAVEWMTGTPTGPVPRVCLPTADIAVQVPVGQAEGMPRPTTTTTAILRMAATSVPDIPSKGGDTTTTAAVAATGRDDIRMRGDDKKLSDLYCYGGTERR